MAVQASSEVEVAAPARAQGRRIVAIDVARGVALVAMTVYHFSWDLSFFGYVDPALVNARPWQLFARSIATSFLLLVGVSLVLAHGRGVRWRGFGVRLAQVAAGAAAISVATWFFVPGGFIFFGILHAIALFSMLALPFLRLAWWATAAVALLVWIVGNAVALPLFDATPFWWLGLAETPPRSNDYVPLFPFFAAVLGGVALARLAEERLWFERWRAAAFPPTLERPLAFVGRHSLLYYLLHQPVLFALIGAFAFATGGPDRTAAFRELSGAQCRAVRSAAFCDAYLACSFERLQAEGLLKATARNALSADERPRVDGIVAACARASARSAPRSAPSEPRP